MIFYYFPAAVLELAESFPSCALQKLKFFPYAKNVAVWLLCLWKDLEMKKFLFKIFIFKGWKLIGIY